MIPTKASRAFVEIGAYEKVLQIGTEGCLQRPIPATRVGSTPVAGNYKTTEAAAVIRWITASRLA